MDAIEQLAKLLSKTSEDAPEGSPQAEEVSNLKNLGMLAVVGLVLLPIIKLTVGGGVFLSTFQYLQKEKKNSKRGGQLAELLGGEKDELAKVSFEVTRVNDSMVSSTAALMEQTQSPLAAERLRETAREARITAGWSSMVVNLHPDKREKVKKALEAYSKAEEDRRFDLISARKDMREAMLKRGLPFAGLFTRIRVENLATDQYYHEIKLLETLKSELSEPEIKALVKALDGSDLLHVPPAALDAQPDTVYVLNFVGDTQASGVAALEKEVSAILGLVMPPNEVIMRVTSPGGTVTGYGLASAEMKRLTKAGIKLTVCIDQLAASGGYLMACVADQIFASPYAAIGSIGVVAQQPNFAERLDREGIEFITTTAGKWKRTVTPFNKPSEEDLAKQKEDIKMVYVQFADTVKRNRPHLDIDQVATGEVWYGSDALSRGLVDALKTSSEYILERIQAGAEVFDLKYKPQKAGIAGLLGASAAMSTILGSRSSSSSSSFLNPAAMRNLLTPSTPQLGGLEGGLEGALAQMNAGQLQLLYSEIAPMLQALPEQARLELARELLKLK